MFSSFKRKIKINKIKFKKKTSNKKKKIIEKLPFLTLNV